MLKLLQTAFCCWSRLKLTKLINLDLLNIHRYQVQTCGNAEYTYGNAVNPNNTDVNSATLSRVHSLAVVTSKSVRQCRLTQTRHATSSRCFTSKLNGNIFSLSVTTQEINLIFYNLFKWKHSWILFLK